MARTVVHLLHTAARRDPRAGALSWRGVSWSYGELSGLVGQVAGMLAARGFRRGDRVALLMRNCPHYVALYYGVLQAGCVVVPLNVHERSGAIVRTIVHSGARLVFADSEHPEHKALESEALDNGVQVQSLEVGSAAIGSAADFGTHLGATGVAPTEADVTAGDLACLIYTSGTTGRPKGVMLSHGNLVANTESVIEYLGLGAHDCVLNVLPFHFSYGNSVLLSHLGCGARVVIEDTLAYPHLVLQRLAEERATGFSGVPSTFALLLSRCKLADFDLRGLRYLTQAGGAMPRPLISRLHEELPHVQLFIMYGQTEATARLTYLPPHRLEEKLGSVGIAIPGVEIVIRRTDGADAERGESGEICARGPNVMQGYWKDEEQTARALRGGWLWTGDLGHLDADGFLYITSRSVDMIKVGAFRVSPQEVEEAIASLAGVEEVAVVGIPDEVLGQSIKAVVVPRAGAQLDARDVKAHCRALLATYKIPKVVEFAASLPRTSSGKIQRFRLSQPDISRVPKS